MNETINRTANGDKLFEIFIWNNSSGRLEVVFGKSYSLSIFNQYQSLSVLDNEQEMVAHYSGDITVKIEPTAKKGK